MERYKEILDTAVQKRKTSYRKISSEYGWVVQQMHQKLKNNTMNIHEFLAFMDILKIDVKLDTSEMLGCPADVNGEPWWKSFEGCREVVEISRLLEAYNIGVKFYLRETGAELSDRKDGMGMRLRAVDDGEMYDTKKGTLLSASFLPGSEEKFDKWGKAEELYVDNSGRYFLAVYSENGKTRIRGIQKEAADIFIDMHGLYK